MTTSRTRARVTKATGVAALGAAALLLAGCGGSSSSGTTAGAASGASPGGAAVTVETHKGAMGTYLTDASGRTLYLFAADTGRTSTCSGACATFWPPLTTTGSPAATGGVKGSLLATINRADGSHQVTYDGHPLYYYQPDANAGDTKGQGSDNFGAKWWLVAPSGQAITAAGGGSSAPSSPAGGGGGWS